VLVQTDDELQPLAVAKIIKALMDKEQVGLVILGKQAIDDDCNQTGQMLAALTDRPQATFASKVEVADGKVKVTREVDGGSETLRTAMAIGADRAVLVQTDDELQPLAVAKIIKALMDKEQVGLVILGKQAIDDDCNQTGQMLAALTDRPQATFASKVEVADGKVKVTREVDGGSETLHLSLPAIITTDLRLNEPRYVTLPNIMKAKKKPLDTMSPADLGVDTTPRIKTIKVVEPPARAAGIKVADVAALIDKLKNEAKVI
jgi:electron transfer flavoprotein beta subunit